MIFGADFHDPKLSDIVSCVSIAIRILRIVLCDANSV